MSDVVANSKVTSVNLTNATPIHVAVVDGAGNQITSFGGGGGGGAVTMADGASMTLGAKGDSTIAFSGSLASVTEMSLLKGILNHLFNVTPGGANIKVDASPSGTINVQQTYGNFTTPTSVILANSNNATSVNGSFTDLISVHVFNKSGSIFYLKLYNQSTVPNPATDTPALRFGVPAGATRDIHFGFTPVGFPSGLGFLVVTGIADNDNTAVAAQAGIVEFTFPN